MLSGNREFLWPNHFFKGTVNHIAGAGGAGKDLVLCSCIAAMTNPEVPWPDGTKCDQVYRVLYASPEDNTKTMIVPRLKAAGADVKQVAILKPGAPLTEDQLEDFDVICVSPLTTLMRSEDLDNIEAIKAIHVKYNKPSRTVTATMSIEDGEKIVAGMNVLSRVLARWNKPGKTVITTVPVEDDNAIALYPWFFGRNGHVVFKVTKSDNAKSRVFSLRVGTYLDPERCPDIKFKIVKDGERQQSIRCEFVTH